MAQIFDIILTDGALSNLDAISDWRTYVAIERKIDELATDPERRGKALGGNLVDFRSAHAAGQRYRVIYQVSLLDGVLTVVVIGIQQEGDKRDTCKVVGKRLKRNRSS